MTDRDETRDQIAHAMGWTTGHFGDVLDAIMAIVTPIAHERDEAQRSANFWQAQAETWEREHQNTVLPYTSQVEDERDLALWLHTEAVWQRQADQLTLSRQIDRLAADRDCGWAAAEQAAASNERLQAELEAQLRVRAAVEEVLDEELGTEPTPETEGGYVANVRLMVSRLRARVADLEGQLAAANAKLQHAQTYADHCAKHAAVEVLRGDVAWHLRQIVTQPPHNCADASCSIQIDPCGGCCTCLGGCVHNGPDEPTSERYVDVHHLVEAEIAIARLTKDSGGRPVQHDVTRVAKAVAAAFDMDLTPEAETASRTTPQSPHNSADGVTLIALERQRQIAKGWTAEHDDRHPGDQLVQAALVLADETASVADWPWNQIPRRGTRIRDLERAGALIAAEIDRLHRAAGQP